jgi:hypothetical protein
MKILRLQSPHAGCHLPSSSHEVSILLILGQSLNVCPAGQVISTLDPTEVSVEFKLHDNNGKQVIAVCKVTTVTKHIC